MWNKIKVIAILIVALFTVTASAQNSRDYSKGYEFSGYGTEPFWELKIDAEKTIYFKDVSLPAIKTKVPKYVPVMDAPGFSYIGESKKYNVNVRIMKQECSDGMSDNKNKYSVTVILNDKTTFETIEYKGCGNFLYDERINDIWVMEKFKGKKVTKDMFMKDMPSMEFRLSDNHLGGNAGCNTFFGNVEVKGNKIEFPKNIGMTKMACDNMEFENDFINTIKGRTLEYKIKKMKLYLYDEGKEVMVFKKVD